MTHPAAGGEPSTTSRRDAGHLDAGQLDAGHLDGHLLGRLPDWLRAIVAAVPRLRSGEQGLPGPPREGSRPAAVLLLFGEAAGEPDILLTERARGLRRHAGQAAFPGGVSDPDDDDAAATALREGMEETGLDPAGVDVVATLPPVSIRVSDYAITPVLAWWRDPSPVWVVDTAEVASVHRVPLAELLDPANRLRIRHPSGYLGPAFRVRGLLVWGFTASILSCLFRAAGIDKPWDRNQVEPLPAQLDPGVVLGDGGEGRGGR